MKIVLQGPEGRALFNVSELPDNLKQSAGSYSLESSGEVTISRGLFGVYRHRPETLTEGEQGNCVFITSRRIGQACYLQVVRDAIFERNRSRFLAYYLDGRWVKLELVAEEPASVVVSRTINVVASRPLQPVYQHVRVRRASVVSMRRIGY